MRLATIAGLLCMVLSTSASAESASPLVTQFMQAWNAADAKALGALFALDADLVTPTGIDSKGRPIELPGNVPTPDGTPTCPDIRGAANWMSTAYNPDTGMYYVMTIENCGSGGGRMDYAMLSRMQLLLP